MALADAAAAPPAAVAPAEADAAYRQALRDAERLILADRFTEARRHLLALEGAGHHDNQLQFLLGLTGYGLKDYDEAIRRFRRILAVEPGAVRVRLELGRAFFAKRDYANAQRQFEFARSGKLPPIVRRRVDGYLARIRQDRTLEAGVSLGIAPDTNINAGPSISSVSLFGLPFQLAPAAKASSGVGAAVAGHISWTPHLSPILRWDLGAVGAGKFYGRSYADDATASVFSGPHLVLDKVDASLDARLTRRWYGKAVYYNGYGASLDVTYFLSGRTGLVGEVSEMQLDYPAIALQNGLAQDYSLGVFHAITASSIGRASFSVGRLGASLPGLANHNVGGELRYLREVRGGFTFTVAARYLRSNYDAPLPAFAASRRDDQVVTQFTLLNRRIDYMGFTPLFSFTNTINHSNVPLYSFQRSQFEVGVTRTF